jgi:hypothetical protein
MRGAKYNGVYFHRRNHLIINALGFEKYNALYFAAASGGFPWQFKSAKN